MSASPGILSVSDEPPYKKLRKGTHSCIECGSLTAHLAFIPRFLSLSIALVASISPRVTDHTTGRRRKKSCVPRPATPGSCEECFTRGVQCRTQEVSLGTKRRPQDGKQDLQQRVAELETALLSISQKLESTPKTIESNGTTKTLQQPRSDTIPSTPVASPGSNPDALLEHAPVLSLFDNAILSRRPDDSTRKDSHDTRLLRSEVKDGSNSKLDNIRRALLSFFPSQQRQEAILNTSYTWWSSWQVLYPQVFGLESVSNVVQFVADLKASGSVQKVAKALLCLLIILQEGNVSLNTRYDIADAADQTRQALSIIDDMVLADDQVAGTIDGVECMILRAKYETNSGRIRRAWLSFRRGISFAQLLGLHKRLVSLGSNTSQSLRRESLWEALYTGDRLLSLQLGLPYGTSEIHSDIGRDSELSAKGIQVPNTGKHYLFRLASIAGHIIDRNQQLPSNNMLPLTFKIEAEMMELAASMPSNWWDSWLQYGAVANQTYSQLLPQFWHHQARTLLHLPFMLKATTDRRFEYSKKTTLESAREMIARYRVIRPVQGFGSLVCKLIDFQAFTAAMILVINLLDHYRRNELFDHSEAENDQDLIIVTTDILRRASVETDGNVATQAARALEIFSKVKEMSCSVGKSVGEFTTRMVIPYFGTVVIGPGTSFRDQTQAQKPEAMPQPQQLPTPSENSLDGPTPESAPAGNSSMAPTMPFDFSYGEDMHSLGMNGDVFADVNFDVDQDWSWFWNNIDIPSVDLQRTVS